MSIPAEHSSQHPPAEWKTFARYACAVGVLALVGLGSDESSPTGQLCADWPQFMCDGGHQGVAEGEIDPSSLGLQHQIELGDALLTSPAIVGGRAFVVDQTGAAHCVDLATGQRVWTSELDSGDGLPVAGNASSPAVVQNRLVYGTTGGSLRFLDLDTGRPLITKRLRWPVTSAVTVANDRVYVPTVDSSLHCFTSDGERLWTWDHYRLAERWQLDYRPADDADRFELPHFGGASVAVIGNRIFAPMGYDLVCLEDRGEAVRERWRLNQPVTTYDVPLGTSTDGETVFCVWPKSDGRGAVIRHRARDGKPLVVARDQWAVMTPPAILDGRAVFNRHAFGTLELDFNGEDREQDRATTVWQSFGITADSVAASMSATAVTKRHAVTTTLHGEVLIFERAPQEEAGNGPREPAYRFELPGSVVTTSSPAIADGRIVFGADDGCLYVLGPGGQAESAIRSTSPRRLGNAVSEREWPGAFGYGDNTSLVRDPDFRPPFRLKWAMPSYGLFKHPVNADRGDLISSSFSGTVVCRDQATGKIHWRRKLRGQAWSRATPLVADGKVFIPRVSSPRYAMIVDQPDLLVCLDQATGELLWERTIGRGDWLRASPVFADGVVAYGSKYETPRGTRTLVGPAQRWRIAPGDPPPEWYRSTFDDGDWGDSTIANDGSVFAWRDRRSPARETTYLRTRFRVATASATGDHSEAFAIVCGPRDELAVYVDGDKVFQTSGWEDGSFPEAAKYVGVAARVVPLDFKAEPGEHCLAIGIRRAGVKSNVSGSSSVFPPRLIAGNLGPSAGSVGATGNAPGTSTAPSTSMADLTGPVIEAWDAKTGEPRWTYSVQAAGSYIEGPAGSTDGEYFYFTGGGAGPDGRGETVALRPANGNVRWSNEQAYACRTGTPAITGERLILPGAIHQPLAALDLSTGKLQWQNDSVTELTLVHSPSIFGNLMTVNTKYSGGAKCWDVENGQPQNVGRGPESSRLDLAGGGHTCSPIVMTASGYAITATNKGIYTTDLSTGEMVAKTPGFASQTCPHPVVANGRIFYSPQNNGMLYCFEPDSR